MQNSAQLSAYIKENYPQGTLNIDLSVSYQLKIGPEGAAVIEELITWPIQQINLNIYFIGNEGMQTIIRAGKRWSNLTHLLLQKNNISCQGLSNIDKVQWVSLKKINLNKNFIKSKGFQYIAKANWPQLQVLQLSHNQIGLNGATHFHKTNWPKLQSLNLNYNLIGCEGMRQLSKCKFPELRKLFISNNKIYAKGMFYLSNIDLPNLQDIGLNRNFIGKNENGELQQIGCYYISQMKVKKIKHMHIFGNDISLNGFRQIIYSGKFAEDAFLQITKNLFEFQEIQEDLKICNIFSNRF